MAYPQSVTSSEGLRHFWLTGQDDHSILRATKQTCPSFAGFVKSSQTGEKEMSKVHILGALLAVTCCASTVLAQDSGQRQATFLGAMQNPGVSPNYSPTDSLVKPFLPTMDAATYAGLKDQGALMPSGIKPGAGLASSVRPRRQTVNIGFAGIDRFGAADQEFIYTPPDVNTASGQGQIVEVTNNCW